MNETKKNTLDEKKYRVACLIAVVVVLLIVAVIFLVFKHQDKSTNANVDRVVAQLGYEEAYKMLTDLQNTAYEKQTVAQFDESIESYFQGKSCTFAQAMESVEKTISPDDLSYAFIMNTLKASCSELNPENPKPYIVSDMTVKYIDNTGAEGTMMLSVKLEYSIIDTKMISVQERDEDIQEYLKGVRNFANQNIVSSMKENDVKDEIETKMADLTKNLSNEKIVLKGHLEEMKIS